MAGLLENSEVIVKGPWSAQEDEILRQQVSANPYDWKAIGRALRGRTVKSCRLRWRHHLAPNIRKDPFTEDEDKMIVLGYTALGPKWAAISKKLPGRTDNAIKNRFNYFIQKRLPELIPKYIPALEKSIQAREHVSTSDCPPKTVKHGTSVTNVFSDVPALCDINIAELPFPLKITDSEIVDVSSNRTTLDGLMDEEGKNDKGSIFHLKKRQKRGNWPTNQTTEIFSGTKSTPTEAMVATEMLLKSLKTENQLPEMKLSDEMWGKSIFQEQTNGEISSSYPEFLTQAILMRLISETNPNPNFNHYLTTNPNLIAEASNPMPSGSISPDPATWQNVKPLPSPLYINPDCDMVSDLSDDVATVYSLTQDLAGSNDRLESELFPNLWPILNGDVTTMMSQHNPIESPLSIRQLSSPHANKKLFIPSDLFPVPMTNSDQDPPSPSRYLSCVPVPSSSSMDSAQDDPPPKPRKAPSKLSPISSSLLSFVAKTQPKLTSIPCNAPCMQCKLERNRTETEVDKCSCNREQRGPLRTAVSGHCCFWKACEDLECLEEGVPNMENSQKLPFGEQEHCSGCGKTS